MILKDPARFVGKVEVGFDVDVERLRPEVIGELSVGSGNREDGSGVDQDVESAKLKNDSRRLGQCSRGR